MSLMAGRVAIVAGASSVVVQPRSPLVKSLRWHNGARDPTAD